MLALHLVPNGVRTFDARFYLVLYAHLVESLPYGVGKLLEKNFALLLCRC